MRNPRRTAATASALVIGLALVAMVAVLRRVGQGARSTSADSDLRAELVLDTKQFTGFSPEVIDRVEALPEVKTRSASTSGGSRSTGNDERGSSA